MTRRYQLLLTIDVEGDPGTVPTLGQMTAEIADIIEENTLSLELCGVSWMDFAGPPDTIPRTATVGHYAKRPRRRT